MIHLHLLDTLIDTETMAFVDNIVSNLQFIEVFYFLSLIKFLWSPFLLFCAKNIGLR